MHKMTQCVGWWVRGRNVPLQEGESSTTVIISYRILRLKPYSLRNPVRYRYQIYLGLQNLIEIHVLQSDLKSVDQWRRVD